MAQRRRVRSVWGTPRGQQIYARLKAGEITREQAAKEAGVSLFSLGQYEKWQDPTRAPYGTKGSQSTLRDDVDSFLRIADLAGSALAEAWKREQAQLTADNARLREENATLRARAAELEAVVTQFRQRFEKAAAKVAGGNV